MTSLKVSVMQVKTEISSSLSLSLFYTVKLNSNFWLKLFNSDEITRQESKTLLPYVTMATSLSGGTRDFLKLSFHMFPYNEILKVFKSKILVDI